MGYPVRWWVGAQPRRRHRPPRSASGADSRRNKLIPGRLSALTWPANAEADCMLRHVGVRGMEERVGHATTTNILKFCAIARSAVLRPQVCMSIAATGAAARQVSSAPTAPVPYGRAPSCSGMRDDDARSVLHRHTSMARRWWRCTTPAAAVPDGPRLTPPAADHLTSASSSGRSVSRRAHSLHHPPTVNCLRLTSLPFGNRTVL